MEFRTLQCLRGYVLNEKLWLSLEGVPVTVEKDACQLLVSLNY